MMRILIISQYFPPDITAAAFRMGETKDCLERLGFDVRVITAEPHKGIANSSFNKYNDIILKDTLNSDVYRVPVKHLYGAGLIPYLMHYMSFVLRALIKGIVILKYNWRPDIIWASSPPIFTGIVGSLLSKLFNIPMVLDVRDIWPESAVSAGQISRNGLAYRIGRWLEKKLYREAASITCISEPMSEYLGLEGARYVTIVYNGVMKSWIDQVEINATDNCQKRILYAGNIGRVQGIDILIKAFAKILEQKELDDWRLEIIGSGAIQPYIEKLIHDSNLSDRVIIHPPKTKEEVIKELKTSSILFMNLKGDAVFELTIPSKVFDYLIAARPIVAGIKGEGYNILKSTGANILFEPNNLLDMANAIRIAINLLESFSEKAARNLQVVKHFTREEATLNLISAFQKTLDKYSSN